MIGKLSNTQCHLCIGRSRQFCARAPLSCPATHRFTKRLGLLGKLPRVFFLHLLHQPLHLLPLDLLLPLLEGRLALDHLVEQAAQRPPVGAEGVALVGHHLWSCRRGEGGGGLYTTRDDLGVSPPNMSEFFLPMYPTVPTRPRMVWPSGT